LFKVVVENNACAVKGVFEKKAEQADDDPWEKDLDPLIGDDLARDVFCDKRKDNDGRGHHRCAKKLRSSKKGITL